MGTEPEQDRHTDGQNRGGHDLPGESAHVRSVPWFCADCGSRTIGRHGMGCRTLHGIERTLNKAYLERENRRRNESPM
jgi:hypothetical protein